MTDGPFGSGPVVADAHTLSGGYAIGALDTADTLAFEVHLAGCAACVEEVRSFRETAARLADGVRLAPPAGLRDRVLAEVRRTPQLPPLQAGPVDGAVPDRRVPDRTVPDRRVPDGAVADAAPDRAVPDAAGPDGGPAGRSPVAGDELAWRHARRRESGRSWLVAAAVAALLAVAGGSFGAVQYRQARVERLARVEAAAQQEQVARVLSDPGRKVVTGPAAGGGSVTLVVAGTSAVVSTAGFAGLPSDRAYQLWLVRADGTIDSAGVGPAASAAAGSWLRPVDGLRPGDAVAVSVEPRAGSRQPTTTPLVALPV